MTNGRDDEKSGGGGRLSPEDHFLWDFVTRTIRPLTGRKEPPAPKPAQPARDKPAAGSRLSHWVPDFGLKAPGYPEEPASAGVDRRLADRLRRGQVPIEARLDLHGMRQFEAQDRLTRFLLSGYDSGYRCVLVITGKGNRFDPEQEAGVLRRMLPVWVGMAPLAGIVLLHSPARPADGGAGAFYILLRRKR